MFFHPLTAHPEGGRGRWTCTDQVARSIGAIRPPGITPLNHHVQPRIMVQSVAHSTCHPPNYTIPRPITPVLVLIRPVLVRSSTHPSTHPPNYTIHTAFWVNGRNNEAHQTTTQVHWIWCLSVDLMQISYGSQRCAMMRSCHVPCWGSFISFIISITYNIKTTTLHPLSKNDE